MFALLRVAQGLCMAAAFTLTLAYLGETSARRTPQRVRRLYHRQCREQPGRPAGVGGGGRPFWPGLRTSMSFAALNLCGAVAGLFHDRARRPMKRDRRRPHAASCRSLARPICAIRPLRAAFAIGFCILFAFIGTFTYVNFVLVRPPFALGMMGLGFVYFVFLPSVVTTPLAGRVVAPLRHAAAPVRVRWRWPLSDLPLLAAAVSVGRLARPGPAQRRHVLRPGGRHGLRRPRGASADRGVGERHLSRLLFPGRSRGSATLGQVYDRLGWPACVGGIALALFVAISLTPRLLVSDRS